MLEIVYSFFSDCTESELKYAIWKSLEKLDAQLDGEEDLDVVFEPSQRDKVLGMLAGHNFLLDALSPSTVGPDVLVFRGFDEPSGRFISLHAHFNCRFGSKTHKECRYAFEREMFEEQIDYHGIKRLCDGHFFAIRLLTVAVREIERDDFVTEIARQYLAGLAERDRRILEDRIWKYFGTEPAELMHALSAGGPDVLLDYRKHVEREIDKDEPRDRYVALVNATRRRMTARRRVAKFLGSGRNKVDRPAEFVITGPDGAGKTTVCSLLKTQLAKIGPASIVYLGRRTWSKPNTFINRVRLTPPWSLLFRHVWPVSSTIELVLRLMKGKALLWLGRYVIYDRSLYDNVLKFDSGYGPSGSLARYTSARLAKSHGDLCFFLFANSDVALSRKPPGKYSRTYLEDTYAQFRQLLPNRYLATDSSECSAEEIANQIVHRYFVAAAQWEARI